MHAWLQNEKRQLETNLVVEQRLQNRETDKDSTASQSDDERDEDDAASVVSNGDGTEDVFFECNTDLARVSGQPIIPSDATTSGASQQFSHPQGTKMQPDAVDLDGRDSCSPLCCVAMLPVQGQFCADRAILQWTDLHNAGCILLCTAVSPCLALYKQTTLCVLCWTAVRCAP